jgi:16S rRNA (uracil1498-N3)-methyltransferase
MDPLLRGSAAHVLVRDLAAPALDERDEHHLRRVLRLRDGEAVTVTDGAGAWRPCRIGPGGLELDGEVRTEPPRPAVTVAVAIPKQDRPEWLVQKLTELGIDRIVLLHATRSVVRWDGDRAERHVAKLRRVAAEAAMQSRRVRLPEIAGPLDAAEVLPRCVAAEPGGRALAADDDAIAVGPEGGWTDRELAQARDLVGLGHHVLRVETAAVAAAAALTALRT